MRWDCPKKVNALRECFDRPLRRFRRKLGYFPNLIKFFKHIGGGYENGQISSGTSVKPLSNHSNLSFTVPPL